MEKQVELAYQALLWLHMLAGSSALVLFWVPVFAPKGGRVHVRVGLVYVVLITITVFTALALSTIVFVDPLSIRQPPPHASPEQVAEFARTERIFAFFLGYLASVILVAGGHGLRVVRHKHEPRLPHLWFHAVLNGVVVLLAVAMLVVGLRERFVILAAFSTVGLLVGIQNLRYLYRPSTGRMAWWYEHLRSMIPTGIAAYTAFLVFGARRVLPTLYQTRYYWVFWILPLVVGVAAIRLTILYYRARFRENVNQARP